MRLTHTLALVRSLTLTLSVWRAERVGECYLPVSAAPPSDAAGVDSRLADYEAVGRVLLAAVARDVRVPSA